VASVVRADPRSQGYRYLHCALCATEWHMVRVTCSQCESTKCITYQAIEGGSEAVRAECCDNCRAYRKILYQEKDGDVDPVADDLASLALDLLLAKRVITAAAATPALAVLSGIFPYSGPRLIKIGRDASPRTRHCPRLGPAVRRSPAQHAGVADRCWPAMDELRHVRAAQPPRPAAPCRLAGELTSTALADEAIAGARGDADRGLTAALAPGVQPDRHRTAHEFGRALPPEEAVRAVVQAMTAPVNLN
jgi:hypothetical protein